MRTLKVGSKFDKINSMKKIIPLFTFLFSIYVQKGHTQTKPEFIFKFSAIAPENTEWSKRGYEAGEYVKNKSGGRVKIIWYLGGVMGDEPDAIRKIYLGQLHGGVFTIIGLQKIIPEIRALALPMMFRSYEEVDFALEMITPVIKKLLEDKGFYLLGWVEVGFVYMFSREKILTKDELLSTKMWSWSGDPFQFTFTQYMGFSKVVELPIYQVYTGLQTGMIDTIYATPYVCLVLQWYKFIKYMNLYPISYTPGGFIVKKEAIDRMPPELINVLKEGINRFIPELNKMVRKQNEDAISALKSYGIIPLQPSEEVIKSYEEMALKIYDKMEEKFYPKWMVQALLLARMKYRTKTLNEQQ